MAVLGLVIVSVAFLVSACAQATRETFDLTTETGVLRSVALRGGPAVFVPEPAALAPTSSDRIVVRAGDDSVAVLPGVQWSDPMPLLFQRRLIEALQQCGLSASSNGGQHNCRRMCGASDRHRPQSRRH
jgi:cholesterol transport system auxiliary component